MMASIARLVGRLAIALVALIALGVGYQLIGARLDAEAHPPPGRLIDVSEDGVPYRLHVLCTGTPDPNRPTVILDTMSGGSSALWGWVQPEIAKMARVCAYDRAGWGWSDDGPEPRDARQVAGELETLLRRSGERAPYVLVGHSLGGLYALAFADRFPAQVEGVVLIDSAHPEQASRLSADQLAAAAEFDAAVPWYSLMERVGIVRLYFALGGTLDFESLPPDRRDEVRAFWSLPRQFDSHVPERDARSATDAQVSRVNLGARPLVVLTAGSGASPEWLGLQSDLLRLSTDSVQRLMPEATHASLVLDRAHAESVVRAIRDVTDAAQTGESLVGRP